MNEEQIKTCPICEIMPVNDAYWLTGEHRKVVDCPVCGRFWIAGELNQGLWERRKQGTISDVERRRLVQLSMAIRHASTIPLIRLEDWEKLADNPPRFTMDTKLRRLLEQIAKWAPLGSRTDLRDFHFRVLTAEIAAGGRAEVDVLVDYVIRRGFLDGQERDHTGARGAIMITVDGWKLLEPTIGVPGRCFVAMWFDPSMNDPYEKGIAAAARDCGLDPRRVDKIDFGEKICDRIVAEIRTAEVVIADFTGFRSGVFYEAGYAQALGKVVVLTCRQDQLPELAKHFDTRQFPHLPWSDPADLRTKLADRIRALRGVPQPI
jgi:hypothetical protein